MASREKKQRNRGSQNAPEDMFTPSVLKIIITNEVDLPMQRDYFFANSHTLKQHGFLIGQPVIITHMDKEIGQSERYVCHPWPLESIKGNCISIVRSRLKLLGLVEGDFVKIEKIDFGIQNAISVRFKCFRNENEIFDKETCGYLATQLSGKYVFVGSRFVVSYQRDGLLLEATHIGPKQQQQQQQQQQGAEDDETTSKDIENFIYRMSNKTKLEIRGEKELSEITNKTFRIETKNLDCVAGLERQAKEVQDIIEISLATDKEHRNFKLSIPSGVLVCGYVGVGKTTLLKSLENYFRLKTSVKYIQTESLLDNTDLSKELQSENTVVLLDDVDGVRDGTIGTNTLISSLCQLIDRVVSRGGVVVASCQRRDDVDKSFKRPGRLEKEIELQSPNSNERFRILQSILKLTPNSVSAQDLEDLTWRAHGYVAGDLQMVVKEATLGMLTRCRDSLEGAQLEFQDLQEGLKKVRPSAMRDVILEVPQVRWTDIGGLTGIIQKIREAVEWPLKHPEAFSRLGLRPPKGILLYGPPGCSKTMIARAIATESRLNFLAVKGPEIFSKWVGDSEKAIRDIFTKARMAAPAIIFFDEIDALAVEREGQGSRVSDRVLTQLLTEMDGLERLEGVTVVAATNRPDLMDKALLRPGRMDRLMYIPIPDSVTRKEIFRIKLAKMSCEPDLDLSGLVFASAGFSGAEIANVCEEAAMICLQEDINSKQIKQQHLQMAVISLKPQITTEMTKFYEDFTKNTFVKKISNNQS